MLPLVLGLAAAAGSLFGKKTAKPVYQQPIDWQQEQSKAIQGNLATLPDAQKLASATNTFNQSESNRLLEQALPGWSKLQSSLMATTQNMLKNPYELDSDTSDYLTRVAAERGISAGTRGQFGDFSLLKDFGITSMQYGQQRINQAQSLTSLLASTAPRVNPMSPISMFVTPQNIAQTTQQQNIANQQVAQSAANNQAAASNYQNQGIWNALGTLAGSVDWGALYGSGLGTSSGVKMNATNQSAVDYVNAQPTGYTPVNQFSTRG